MVRVRVRKRVYLCSRGIELGFFDHWEKSSHGDFLRQLGFGIGTDLVACDVLEELNNRCFMLHLMKKFVAFIDAVVTRNIERLMLPRWKTRGGKGRRRVKTSPRDIIDE
jgi:hypothetical protein